LILSRILGFFVLNGLKEAGLTDLEILGIKPGYPADIMHTGPVAWQFILSSMLSLRRMAGQYLQLALALSHFSFLTTTITLLTGTGTCCLIFRRSPYLN
jgi:hypothetical protein